MLGDQFVAGLQHLVEVVPGVDVHDRERQPTRGKGLDGQMQHDDRVLATGEQQHGPFELGGHLADDVDGLGLQGAQVAQLVARGGRVQLGRGTHRISIKLVEMTKIADMTGNLIAGAQQCQYCGATVPRPMPQVCGSIFPP